MDGDVPLVIDGSVMEGGGQILRVAVACAVISHRPVHVKNIRAGRSKPGLSNQHLTGILLSAELSKAKLSGCALGSTELKLTPMSAIHSGEYEADAKTAGSISLLLQIAVPILAYASPTSKGDSLLCLKGGTDAQFAPPVDYIKQVTFHYYAMMGLNCDLQIVRRGFYPQGGGLVNANVERLRAPLIPLRLLEAGSVDRISGHAFVAGRVPIKVAHEMKQECLRYCSESFPSVPVDIQVFREEDHRCVGNVSTFLFIVFTSNGCRLAASGLGDPRGPRPAQLVREAMDRLARAVRLGACCDQNMQDQLILPMALAAGRSEFRTESLTLHTKTAIYVVESMLPVKFSIVELADGAVVVGCDGIGFKQAV
ncbi:RNA terminal phosphate cyclase domain 1 [Paragonimus heterotremus]|uniref:RNA 3'-terminal phosphate cyclase n=1 Tax=Paragonimus heterotremus TaxID=100268 RepID=A0A8J4T193_9TREM|nr:RNA terminal phosphate cyclase domain 1 [Paragonimus heterotremus]